MIRMKYRQPIGLTALVAATLLLAQPANAQTRVQTNGLDNVNTATVSNPNPVQIDVSGAAVSASNPLPSQLSQGGAANSATNPILVQTTDGTNANAPTHGEYTQVQTTTVANITSLNSTVGGTAGEVSLTAASSHIKIRNNTSTSNGYILYVSFPNSATATTSNFAIDAQDTETFEFATPISNFSVIGSHATTAYSVFAD